MALLSAPSAPARWRASKLGAVRGVEQVAVRGAEQGPGLGGSGSGSDNSGGGSGSSSGSGSCSGSGEGLGAGVGLGERLDV